MLRHRQPHAEEVPSDIPGDEERIRADERASVEDELRTLHEDGGGRHGDAVVGGDPVDPTVSDDRLDRDDRVTVSDDDRHDRDDRVLVSDDDRLDRDDRVTVREDEPIEVVRTRSFSFGQLVTMLAGGALVALGIAALVKTGVDSPLNEPVEPVLGWNHTPLLGIMEIVAGALLVLFSLRPGGRWLVALVGLALIVGGVLIAGELNWTVDELGAEQGFAWVPIVAGVVALLASLLTPRRHQRMTGVPVVR